jgi:hypothetical protein
VTYREWYTRSLDGPWRQVVAQEIFQIACNVVMEEASSVRTPPTSTEVNALQNQFREGVFSAIRSFRGLAQPVPEPPKALKKPWERDEEEIKLPPGPVKP